jgi:hypothetical protein
MTMRTHELHKQKEQQKSRDALLEVVRPLLDADALCSRIEDGVESDDGGEQLSRSIALLDAALKVPVGREQGQLTRRFDV